MYVCFFLGGGGCACCMAENFVPLSHMVVSPLSHMHVSMIPPRHTHSQTCVCSIPRPRTHTCLACFCSRGPKSCFACLFPKRPHPSPYAPPLYLHVYTNTDRLHRSGRQLITQNRTRHHLQAVRRPGTKLFFPNFPKIHELCVCVWGGGGCVCKTYAYRNNKQRSTAN